MHNFTILYTHYIFQWLYILFCTRTTCTILHEDYLHKDYLLLLHFLHDCYSLQLPMQSIILHLTSTVNTLFKLSGYLRLIVFVHVHCAVTVESPLISFSHMHIQNITLIGWWQNCHCHNLGILNPSFVQSINQE